MSALKDRLTAELPEAMKARNATRVTVLRSLLAAIGEAETAGKARTDLDDATTVKVLRKQAAQRQESARIYAEAGDEERAAGEREEAAVIEEYLPRQASEEELTEAVRSLIAGLTEEERQSGGRAIGTVMKQLKATLPDFDGKAASAIIKAELGI